jgi:hypothetical protein
MVSELNSSLSRLFARSLIQRDSSERQIVSSVLLATSALASVHENVDMMQCPTFVVAVKPGEQSEGATKTKHLGEQLALAAASS